MAHIGRSSKNVETPRPLKTQSRSSLKNSFIMIEDLISLIEGVTASLSAGTTNAETMAALVQNLRIHGPQLENVSKNTLDRAFVVFRNASQDERLNIMTRLNLLELIELRAKGWEDNGANSYYKTKQATSAELPELQHHVDASAFLSTSPTFGGLGGTAAIGGVGSAQQQQLLLGPGEVIRNSGKFAKPTKIPGKTYCKDEVVIRNADSGKVSPGAKERLVQITGPSEEKINYAKQLIEDTIRRNASPVRLEPASAAAGATGIGGGGSCSSLASSNSDEVTMRASVNAGGSGGGGGGSSSLQNRLSFNSAQNFMTASAAVAHNQQQIHGAPIGGKIHRPQNIFNPQLLLHSFSTNDASVGEYKYTVNVGANVIKITGDCFELVKHAKLILDDYFNAANFLPALEAYDGISPLATPSTPIGPPQFGLLSQPLADSGVGLNYMAGQIAGSHQDGEDEVFTENSSMASQNGLARSRRSHFSRKDSTPEMANATVTTGAQKQTEHSAGAAKLTRVVHEYADLLYYAKSPYSWALPIEWTLICNKFPSIIRNKVNKPLNDVATIAQTKTASITTASITTTTPAIAVNSDLINITKDTNVTNASFNKHISARLITNPQNPSLTSSSTALNVINKQKPAATSQQQQHYEGFQVSDRVEQTKNDEIILIDDDDSEISIDEQNMNIQQKISHTTRNDLLSNQIKLISNIIEDRKLQTNSCGGSTTTLSSLSSSAANCRAHNKATVPMVAWEQQTAKIWTARPQILNETNFEQSIYANANEKIAARERYLQRSNSTFN